MAVPRGDQFPGTRWSAIVAARSSDEAVRKRGFDAIVEAYWRPIYKYVRLRWRMSTDDAQDLTQEFFCRLIERRFLDGYDPARARLRSFLRVCVDRFLANETKAAARLKRGAGKLPISLDFDVAERELNRLGDNAGSAEEFFEKEWVRSLFSLAVEQLRNECHEKGKTVHFRLFEIYDLEEHGGRDSASLSYQQLAEEFGITATAVTNHLAYARREFRRITLSKLQEMTAGEDEFRQEARSLLGVEAR
jgi:RNA polymerase sigma factor (sigma-70 family)